MRVELTDPQAHACDVRLRDGEQLFVGRSSSCEVVIPCKSVSKRHARFVRQDDQVVIEDLGSRNGIRVNGVQVDSAFLDAGDVIQVGRATLRLKGRNALISSEETGFEVVELDDEGLKPRLVLVEDLKSSWDLTESSTIGCRSENSICIEGLGVSRFHAEVVKQGESWVIQDLGATNGVTVNGEKVDRAVLESGDEILIGETLMRFELVAPRSAHRSTLRLVLAAAVALFCCATGVAASTGAAPVEVAAAVNEDFLAGKAALLERDYARAEDRLAAAELTLERAARSDCRALRQLARELGRVEAEPAAALWSRGEELVERCLRLRLEPELDAWLADQRDFMRANRGAQERLDLAQTQVERGQQEPEFDAALDAFVDAAVLCEAISAGALCSGRARDLADHARGQAIARVTSDLRGLEAQTPPAWTGIQAVAERGLEFAREDVQLKLELRQTITRSQRERAAAMTLTHARELVAAARHEAGLRELERIADSSYYAPAKAELAQRVALARLLGRAQDLYARGAGQQARDALDEAFDLDRLPLQEVQQQVGALRQAWVAVEREFVRATRAEQAGDRVAARDGFTEVLRLEPDTHNRYHELALERLAYAEAAIRDELQGDLRTLRHVLEAPLESLRRDELADAARLIEGVQRHAGATAAQQAEALAWVKVFAARLDAEERVKDALFANDLDACQRLHAQLAFLDTWLPAEAAERAGLATAQERLGKRLARHAITRRLSESSK